MVDLVMFEGFMILDIKGDVIKLQDCNGIIICNVKIFWRGGVDEFNGGYGFYLVLSWDVFIENCEASYVFDVGIYVG